MKFRFQEVEMTKIPYKAWIAVNRCVFETVPASAEEFTDTLFQKLDKLVTHDFLVQRQKQFLENLKNNLQPGQLLVFIDFSENYAFKIQEAVSQFYYNNASATLLPVVIYYKVGEELQHLSWMGISNCMKHDCILVYTFQTKLIEFLKSKFDDITEINYFSDGAPSQFKNKNAFMNLDNHETDFRIPAIWHFFPTAHGKTASDGLGGSFKRNARRHSLQTGANQPIVDAQTLFRWAKLNEKKVTVEYVSIEDYQGSQLILEPRHSKAVQITGTKKFHCLIPSSQKILLCKVHSASDTILEMKIMKGK